MKRKINLRLAGITILAVIATVIGITIVYYSLFQRQVRSDLRVSAKLLRETHFFEGINADVDKIDMSSEIKELRVTWIDCDGKVLYDNDAMSMSMSNHLNRPEIQDAIANGTGEAVRRSDTMNKDTYYYAILLDDDTILRVSINAESLWAVFMSVAPVTIFIIFCITAICLAITHVLTKQLIRPIETMAQKLEDADYETPYKELEPFAKMIRTQHADILSAAKARQDFTANVSHELKTPLTAISGYAELIESGNVGEEETKHFCSEIRKNSDRLLVLINDIIRLSELDRNDRECYFEEIDLYDTVKECMDELYVNAKKRDISLSLEGESCKIRANKDMIKELIENLAQNAIRYNTEGGKVVISVSKKSRPMLVVKDNGIGIPASEQDRIFERFYRVDKSRSKATGGTGLGLAIVKHIVDIHDAKIELDSAPGVGTTISIIF